jgi:putative SOS response-associated peptidase YedK
MSDSPQFNRYEEACKQLVDEYFDSTGVDDWIPRYNVAPTQPVPIIRQHPKEPRRELSLVRWGLIPISPHRRWSYSGGKRPT